ncbi:MAG: amidophosphoribosyltransferase [Deltaproteobacteria bacterium]|nr:amidophosphoribosyltransferase [Deltaproteobacteria bacterium]
MTHSDATVYLPPGSAASRGDGPREACGVFAVYGHPEAAKLCYFGLYALQHRGQESAGIVATDGREVREHRHMGLVSEVFNEKVLEELSGHTALGHVRYSTTGSSLIKNAQPFVVQFAGESIAMGHNGNLTNSLALRIMLENSGSIFQTTMDSEIIVHLLVRHLKDGLEEALLKALPQARGAYSLGLLIGDTLVGARDPNGFRPLCLGSLDGAWILASETCALDLVEAEYVREVEPGEIVLIDQHGLRSLKIKPRANHTFCIFEYIYFSRPDSTIFSHNVYSIRKRLGVHLAKEYSNLEADLTMPFPDSGNYAGLGYSEASGIPFEMGVIRNHYIGRTFIQPSQSMRDFGVRVKLNPVKEILKGKRIIIIEDSIIRGTTSRTRIKTLRQAGAKEVHMLVSCPPHRFPCYYGIDFSSKGELVAAQHDLDWVTEFIGLDSLGYLSLEGLVAATGFEKPSFCLACFNGEYPVPVESGFSKLGLEERS